MQYEILSFLQSIASGPLMAAANLLSFIGEETVMILILLVIYYTVDKKAAFSSFSSLLSAQIVTNTIKAIVRFPRPFAVHPELGADRLESATGYSFPSGHTTGAAAFYPALGRELGKRCLLVLMVVLAILIGLSRNMLRVHWPLDVIVGLFIGLVASLAAGRLFDRIYQNRKARVRFCTVASVLTLVFALVLCTMLTFHLGDEMAYSDLMKVLALASGAYLGCLVETKKVSFRVQRKKTKAVLSVAIAMLVSSGIMASGSLFPQNIYYPVAFLRYLLTGLWTTGLFPLIAIRAGLLEKDASGT